MALKKEHELDIPKDLAYVEGKLFDNYIHDMKLTQQFAILNRKAMVDVMLFDICELSGFEIEGRVVLVDKRTGRVWR